MAAGSRLGSSLSRRPRWRLGTTSCVYQEGLLDNVRRLAGSADDIELVLFDTPELDNWPSRDELRELALLKENFGLSYTVHIPSHLSGVICDSAWEEWTYRVVGQSVESFAAFNPLAYVWHWEAELFGAQPAADVARWRESIAHMVERVASAHWTEPGLLAVETLSYPFALIDDLVEAHGFGVTLDVGHLWRAGFAWEEQCARYWERIRVVHLHGIDAEGRDHQSLVCQEPALLERLASILRARKIDESRALTLEVFDPNDWEVSRSLWQQAEQRCIRS